MYSFSTRLSGSLEEVEAKVAEALMEEGFGILTEIDVQATLKKKIGVDRPAYKILGACNPKLANQAITAEPDIGLLLPCNVVIRASGEEFVVSFMDPEAVLSLVDSEDVGSLAGTVRQKLERVKDKLEKS